MLYWNSNIYRVFFFCLHHIKKNADFSETVVSTEISTLLYFAN